MKPKISKYKARILKERMIAADKVLGALEEAWRTHYGYGHTLSADIFNNIVIPAQKAMLMYDDEYKEKVLGLPRPQRS